MAYYYCKWCGCKSSNVATLTSYCCSYNPNGNTHELYEGGEKSQYTCKYCGSVNPVLSTLTSKTCSKSPSKRHEPAI